MIRSTEYIESRSFGLAPDAPVASTTRMFPPTLLWATYDSTTAIWPGLLLTELPCIQTSKSPCRICVGSLTAIDALKYDAALVLRTTLLEYDLLLHATR